VYALHPAAAVLVGSPWLFLFLSQATEQQKKRRIFSDTTLYFPDYY